MSVGGMPAHNGVAAALMVASGFTGVEDVLSGEANFLSVFSPDADRDSAGARARARLRNSARRHQVLAGRGRRYKAPLHVLRDLIQQHGFKADDVEKLVVRMPDKRARNGR